MPDSMEKRSFDHYLQIFLVLCIILELSLFVSLRFLRNQTNKDDFNIGKYEQSAFEIEQQITQRESEVKILKAGYVQKTLDYQREVVQIAGQNISALEKSEKKTLLRNLYSAGSFEEIQMKIERVQEEIQQLQNVACSLSCKSGFVP